jgi:hypothetical protein
MRVLLAVVLFMASSGIIFAGYTADTSLPGIAEDMQATLQETCGAQSAHGDQLMGYLSLSESESGGGVHSPNKSTVNLLRYLTCEFLD